MSEEERRNLFLVATGQDTGGWNWRIREAFRRHSATWQARAMAATRTYIEYPVDLPYRRQLLLEEYARADAIHLQNQTAGWELYDNGAGKPTVLQHHGTIFREGHAELSATARRVGMVEIASTLDLTLLEPGVEWIAVPYQLEELRRIRDARYQPHGTIRIAHAPTNRAVKGTEHFLRVVARLQALGYPVELVLIEHKSWRQCLELKATADVFYDQLELGYGCNAVEAWGMGLPVVAGAADPQVRRLMLERWGRLPFVEATPESLERVLLELVQSATARQEGAELGLEHFMRWHEEERVARQFEELYSSAPATMPGPVREAAKLERHASRSRERAARQEKSLQRALARRAELRQAARERREAV